MPSCYLLTAAQLAAKLAQGYTHQSGPHNTQAECEAVCGRSSSSISSSGSPTSTPIQTDCCANTIPSVIYGTITGNNCAGSYQFVFNNTTGYWQNVTTIGTCVADQILLICETSAWRMESPNTTTVSPQVTVCDPFSLTFNNVDFDVSCGCDGPGNIVFTA